MEPKDWGGLLETVYTNFDEKDIPEKIAKLKTRVQALLNMKCEEFVKEIKTFTEEERNYLNSPVLDTLYDIYKDGMFYWSVKRHFSKPIMKFILNSKLFIGIRLSGHNIFAETLYDKFFEEFLYTRKFIENPTEDKFFLFSSAYESRKIYLPKDAFDETGKVKEKYLYLLDYDYYIDNFYSKDYGKTIFRKIIDANII